MILQMKMFLLVAVLFGILYALLVAAGSIIGVGGFLFYGILATALMFVQFFIGPKIVEWAMKVKYVSEKDEPELHKMIAELAKDANIPKPRVAISENQMPNAFAFGRWKSDSRVCVTSGILKLLNKDELRAVLGHEISHIKHRDVLVITLISVIPSIAWYLATSLMYSRGKDRGNTVLLGFAAFIIYFITNLLVLYGSRIREYYADRGSVSLGSKPTHLASALYKLVYGSAKTPKSELKKVEGMKAFFANDPSRAQRDFTELSALDKDLSGHIDESELTAIRENKIKIGGSEKLMEILSTHPNMLKRISALAKL